MAFDWNKPFQTRDGRKARLEHVLSEPAMDGETHIVRVGNGDVNCYHPCGSFYDPNEQEESCWDLVNIPEKKVVQRWMVLNSEGGASHRETDYAAKQLADEWQAMGRKTRIVHIREEF